MRNRALTIATLLAAVLNIAPQNFSLTEFEFCASHPVPYFISFSENNRLTLSWIGPDSASWDMKKTFEFQTRNENGLDFILLNESIPDDIEIAMYGETAQKTFGNKILLLTGKTTATVFSFNKLETIATNLSVGYTLMEAPSKSYSFILDVPMLEGTLRTYKVPSSELEENGIKYTVDDLDDLRSDTPWIESAPGYGIGESFIIENTWNTKYSTILIINGFISPGRPYLYEANGRVKEIRIRGLTSGASETRIVLDTPHPQTVDISFLPQAEDIKITIEDAYPGNKWEDTAIHYLITYDREVIPYRDSIE